MPYLVGFPTPQDYGALGNGTNDDTAAIQAALTAAPLGGTVYLPPGTYATSSPLYIPPQVTLWGSHSSHLDSTVCCIKPLSSFSGAAVILIVDQATGGYSVASNQQGLSCLTLEGSNLTGSTIDGIQVQGFVHGLIMQDLQIRDMPNHGVYAVSNGSGFPYSWRGTRIVVQACQGYGYAIGGQTDTTWIDCEALGCQKSGWLLAAEPSNSKFIGCRSEYSNWNGWEISGSWTGGNAAGGCTLTDCSTDGNNRNGIYITATGDSPLSIIGGYYRRDGANGTAGGGSYAGIQATGSTIPVDIMQPTVIPGVANSGGANSPQYGVSVNTSAANFSVDGGVIYGATAAWNDDGSNSNLFYGPNVIERVGTQTSYTTSFLGLQTGRNSSFLANAPVVPAVNPSGGITVYAKSGAGYTRDPNGNVFSLMDANPIGSNATGALAETIPYYQCTTNAAPVSGDLYIQPVFLPAGTTVGHIGFVNGTTATTAASHWWVVLLDSTYKQQGHCADQTTTNITASAWHPLALAASYTATYSGRFYLGLMVATSSGSQPNPAAGTAPIAAMVTGTSAPTPLFGGLSSTGQTTPGTDGSTVYAAPSAAFTPIYMYAAP